MELPVHLAKLLEPLVLQVVPSQST